MNRAVVLLLIATSCCVGCSDSPSSDMDGAMSERDGSIACAADGDCDDGLFCNGVETCVPGGVGDGCVAGTAPCSAMEMCLETSDVCATECPDFDGDGHEDSSCGGDDCDDRDERRYPGNVELCDSDGLDEDCDPATLGDDGDLDGYVSDRCCNELPTGRVECGLDCDDARESVGPEQVDVCGGGDQDCDGRIDENPDQTFYRDVDGDGHGVADETVLGCSAPPGYAVIPGDCDDSLGGVNPGVEERCNLRDDDCDATVDEGCDCAPEGRSETCGPAAEVGECRFGSVTCVAGTWSACSGAVVAGVEICEGSADENCNGMIDEGCECINGATRTCGSDTGACRSVTQGCVDGRWPRDCSAEPGVVSPTSDLCDGLLDQDCDGAVDEGCACTNGTIDRSACGTDAGECVSGMRTCTAGAWGSCSGGVGQRAEVCEGSRDEDCDGAIDEGCGCTNGTSRPCGVGACAGTQSCAAGAWGACSGAAPGLEICNGIDNDCDGRLDSSDPDTVSVGATCGTSVGLCTTGVYSCPGSSLVCSGIAPVSEICDHRDQDCDGLFDDGVGLATCSRTFQSSDPDSFTSRFRCSISPCSAPGDEVRVASSGESSGRTAELRLPGSPDRTTIDWGASMSIAARFDMRPGPPETVATGSIGVIVAPSLTPVSSAWQGLPLQTGTNRGFAVIFNAGLLHRAEIWEVTATQSIRRSFSTALPGSCVFTGTTTREVHVTMATSAGTITGTVSIPGCGTVSTSYTITNWESSIYGNSETAPYPQYLVGAHGYSPSNTTAELKYFSITRTRTSTRGHCLPCNW